MPTNFNVSTQDLDQIFLPLKTTKRPDVGFLIETSPGVFQDISNRYEPVPNPQDSPGEVIPAITTNYINSINDLRLLFASINFRGVFYEYFTQSETADSYNYGFNDNGIVNVRILNANLASPETTHSYTITVFRGATNTVSQTQTITFTGNTSGWVTFTGIRDSAPISSPGVNITVSNNNGISDVTRFIPVLYGGPPRILNPASGTISIGIGR